MHLHARTAAAPTEGPRSFLSWQLAVWEFGLALNRAPAQIKGSVSLPFEIGVVGMSGVGKSSLLNALISPTQDLLPAGGVGPLTGVPVRIFHSSTAMLRVRYLGRSWVQGALDSLRGAPVGMSSNDLLRFSLACKETQYASRDSRWIEQAMRYTLDPDVAKPPDETPATRDALRAIHRVLNRHGSVHQWDSPSADGAFFRRVHEHISGRSSALCESIEIGWPSILLETGVTILDLPGLGTVNDAYAHHTDRWVEHARAILLVTDRSGVPESVAACLRRTGFLQRVIGGEADLIAVATKLDEIADDQRRAERSANACGPWSRCFRSIVERAEAELRSQIDNILRYEQGHPGSTRGNANLPNAARVFGVSSREHQRVVQRDEEQRPKLHLAESSGVPGVLRAITALARLRSNQWTSEILDYVRSAPNCATLLPELLSLVDME
jgi:hypothetical protein